MTPKYENKKIREGFTRIIGCDEVGRGCLAGPVVAAAVILKNVKHQPWFHEVRDSKQLLPKKREELSEIIKANALWGIGVVEEKIIDEINIHNASLLAMRRAVEDLLSFWRHSEPRVHPSGEESLKWGKGILRSAALPQDDASRGKMFLYLDGKFPIPSFNMQQEAVVEGDRKILSVAAASIVAKVFRDKLMQEYHQKFPIYNFAQHKGYATFHHRQMIAEHGLSSIHRLSFCNNLL